MLVQMCKHLDLDSALCWAMAPQRRASSERSRLAAGGRRTQKGPPVVATCVDLDPHGRHNVPADVLPRPHASALMCDAGRSGLVARLTLITRRSQPEIALVVAPILFSRAPCSLV
jgi:hypothetical protein